MDNRFPPLLTILSAILIALLACGGNELRAAESQSLMTDGASKLGWAFDNGQEFPGATGELLEIPDGPGGEPFLRLSADFSGGGIYVEMVRGVKAGPDGLIRMKVRSKQEAKLRVRLIDSTGQCHQGQPLVFATDGEWQDVEIVPAMYGGGEHWGGADDGQWHEPLTKIAILLSNQGEDKQPSVDFAQIQTEAAE